MDASLVWAVLGPLTLSAVFDTGPQHAIEEGKFAYEVENGIHETAGEAPEAE